MELISKQEKNVKKTAESVRPVRSTRASVRSSIALHMEPDADARPAGRGESMYSVNGSPLATTEDSRLTRRVTLRGLDNEIELSCILPEKGKETQKSNITIDSLDKEELIRMRDALKKAQEQAESLLAQFGV